MQVTGAVSFSIATWEGCAIITVESVLSHGKSPSLHLYKVGKEQNYIKLIYKFYKFINFIIYKHLVLIVFIALNSTGAQG